MDRLSAVSIWAGWFDHWGAKHAHTNTENQVGNLDWILRQGYSVSIYMFHGGTSFGWMNGANIDNGNYDPDVTSYDYDAALDESGRPTAKYFAFRDVITKATGIVPPPVPEVAAPISIPAVPMVESASLRKNLPEPIRSERVLSMEDVDQAYGHILYRIQLKRTPKGELVLDQLHSYAQVYLDGRMVGTLDRRLREDRLVLPAIQKHAQFDTLVENTGRVNYGRTALGPLEPIGRLQWRTKISELYRIASAVWSLDTLTIAHLCTLPLQGSFSYRCLRVKDKVK